MFLPLVDVFLPQLVLHNLHHLLFLALGHTLGPWPCPGVNNMSPVALGPFWKLLPPLDEKNTGVTDLSHSGLLQLETLQKIFLVLLTVRES